MAFQWTPKVAEELLFRGVMQNEDITSMVPPPPQVERSTLAHQYEMATRPLRQFFSLPLTMPSAETHPTLVSSAAAAKTAIPSAMSSKHVAASASQAMPMPAPNPIIVVSKAAPTTVSNAMFAGAKTPKARELTPPPAVVIAAPAPSTPKAISASTPKSQGAAPLTPSGKRARSDGVESPRSRKVRIEWPADIPTNAMLKGKPKAQLTEATTHRLAKQQCFDPDLIFKPPRVEFPLSTIFAQHPKAVRMIAAMRGASGDWHDDTFTKEEEDEYKRECGIVYKGESQHHLPLMAEAAAQLSSNKPLPTAGASTTGASKSNFFTAVYKALPSFPYGTTTAGSPEIPLSNLGGFP